MIEFHIQRKNMKNVLSCHMYFLIATAALIVSLNVVTVLHNFYINLAKSLEKRDHV